MSEISKLKERQRVIEMRLSGTTFKDIHEKTGHDKKYVKKWLNKWRQFGNLQDSHRKGAPKRLTQCIKKKIIVALKKKNSSCRKVSQKFKNKSQFISKSTIHRIAKENGMRNVSFKKKPFLSSIHQKKRLEFGKLHNKKTLNYWKRVIWSDESVFQEGGSYNKIWIESNDKQPIKPKKQYPIKIQVWGAIGWKGKSKLHFISKGIRVNSELYQNILQESLLPCIHSISCKPPILMHDGATSHTSASTKNWLKSKKIKVLSNWPAYSPDLNPIENLWGIIKQRIDLTEVSSQQEIFKKVKKEWDNLSQTEIQNLILSVPRRISSVINVEGKNTKY